MSESIGRVDLDLGINHKQFNRDLSGISNHATHRVGGAFKKLGAIIGTAFAITGIVRFGKSAIGLASDLAEVQNVVDVTFGKMSNDVNQFAKDALLNFGLAELSAKRYTSTMGAMLKSTGLTGTQMKNMSKTLTGLSADMASFYNLDTDVAFQKIRAGISGETEPLKQLGINLSVANLEAFALSKGIKESYNKMSEANKVQLRYQYLLKTTADAQGDFARTSDGWANQTRILGEQWKTFQTIMGQGFINLLTPVLQGLNNLILKLQTAAKYFKAFTEMVFGSSKAAGSAAGGMANDIASVSDSTGDMGKAVKKAGKDISGSLGGFDELNVIGQTAAASMGDIAGGAGAGLDMDMSIPDLDKDGVLEKFSNGINIQPMIDSFNRFKTAMEPLKETLFSGLKWSWDNIFVPFGTWTGGTLVPSFLEALGGALGLLNPILTAFQPLALALWDNFLKPIASWTGGVIVTVLSDIGSGLSTIGDWMSDNQEIVKNSALAVAGFFGAWKIANVMAFIQISGGVTEAFKLMSKAIWLNTGAKIINGAQTALLTILYAVDFVAAIVAGTKKMYLQIATWGYLTTAMAVNRLAVLASTISMGFLTASIIAWNFAAGIGAAVTWSLNAAIAILLSPITLIIAAIVALVAGIWLLIKNWDAVAEAGKASWEWIKKAWSATAEWFTEKVIDPVKKFFKGLWESVTSLGSSAWEGTKKVWKIASGWVSDKITTPITNFFKDMWNGAKSLGSGAWEGIKSIWTKASGWISTNVIDPIAKVFSGLWEGIKTKSNEIWTGMITKIKSGINEVISLINMFIGKFNGINIKIPKISLPEVEVMGKTFGGGSIGGQSFGVPQIPKIPALANGGMVNSPTLAMVGDNKNATVDPEVISPLSKLQDIMGASNEAIIEVLLMILEAIEGQDNSIEIDGEKLTRIVRNKLDIEDNRIGKKRITIGGVSI